MKRRSGDIDRGREAAELGFFLAMLWIGTAGVICWVIVTVARVLYSIFGGRFDAHHDKRIS